MSGLCYAFFDLKDGQSSDELSLELEKLGFHIVIKSSNNWVSATGSKELFEAVFNAPVQGYMNESEGLCCISIFDKMYYKWEEEPVIPEILNPYLKSVIFDEPAKYI